MRDFVLWLDESGTFLSDHQKDRGNGLMPSLIGGILIEKSQITDAGITDFLQGDQVDGYPHSVDYDIEKRRRILIPALQAVCGRGGRLVYFENRERETKYDNRELYLRLMASGLVQLIQFLAKDGPFVLDVTIASRSAPEEKNGVVQKRITKDGTLEPITVHIDDDEYMKFLKLRLKEEFRQGRLDLGSRCRLNMCIQRAKNERRLQLADYASNARFSRNSHHLYDQAMRKALEKLFEKSLIFTIQPQTTRGRILSCLGSGRIADALMILYHDYEDLNHAELLGAIADSLQSVSYRFGKAQLLEFVDDLALAASGAVDYENLESVLKAVDQELFPYLEKAGITIPLTEAKVNLLNALTQMYLREGDLLNAGEVLDEIRTLLPGMSCSIEHLRYLYAFYETESLYQLGCMDYEAAENTAGAAVASIRKILELLSSFREDDELLAAYFPEKAGKVNIDSRMLVRALTMKAYAGMLRCHGPWSWSSVSQAAPPEDFLWQEIRHDIHEALANLEDPAEGEWLHLYEAYLEKEAGNIYGALRSLFRVGILRKTEMSESSIEIDLMTADDVYETCRRFLASFQNENGSMRIHFLLYYVEIMLKAGQLGQITESAGKGENRSNTACAEAPEDGSGAAPKGGSDENDLGSIEEDISRSMYKALLENIELMEEFLIEDGLEHDFQSDVKKDFTVHEDVYWDIFSGRPRAYHPMEILLWRYGTYQLEICGNAGAGMDYLERAVKICTQNPDYLGMRVAALAISLEMDYWNWYLRKQFFTRRDLEKIVETAESVILAIGTVHQEKTAGPSGIVPSSIEKLRAYVMQIRDMAAEGISHLEYQKENRDMLMRKHGRRQGQKLAEKENEIWNRKTARKMRSLSSHIGY